MTIYKFIVDFPINSMVIFSIAMLVYQRVIHVNPNWLVVYQPV